MSDGENIHDLDEPFPLVTPFYTPGSPPPRVIQHIYTTEPGETIVATVPFKDGIVIATSLKVMYYGPDGALTVTG